MSIGAPWIGTTFGGNAFSTDLDVSGAPDGEWVFAFIHINETQISTPSPPSGWTETPDGSQFSEGPNGSPSSQLMVYMHMKEPDDTTFTFSWPTEANYAACAISWPGLHPDLPIGNLYYRAKDGLFNPNFPTASIIVDQGNREIVTVTGQRSSGQGAPTGITNDIDLVERVDFRSAVDVYAMMEICDTVGGTYVSGGVYSYTAVSSVSSLHGGTIIFTLIPALHDQELTSW